MVFALVIVSHPDDETIWMGGFILSHPDWNWRVECLSRDWDTDREPKFRRVMEQLGVRGRIHGLIDEPLDQKQDIGELADKIAGFAGPETFDFVFFHGWNGEYGHIRHKELHRAVKLLLQSKRLRTKRAYTFAYKKQNGIAVPVARSGLECRLDAQTLQKKKFLITKVYGFSESSFEALSCHAIERFRRMR